MRFQLRYCRVTQDEENHSSEDRGADKPNPQQPLLLASALGIVQISIPVQLGMVTFCNDLIVGSEINDDFVRHLLIYCVG